MTVYRKLDDLPHKVKKIEHFWITLKDGCRLAARMWLPADAESKPVPAVLEYIPYRKRDGTRGRDEPMHGYFAGHGYAAIRVDMRGSGESDGVLQDEYLQLELDDAVEVIDWITRQPWCDGKVGMMGKSWGGFNCLQVAAMRPKSLKAVLSVCSTDDRYADDIHYMGGCLLNDNHWWGDIMLAYQARPRGPGAVRRRMARQLAEAPQRDAVLARDLDEAPGARRLLAPRLDLRGLWRDPMPGDADRRLGRCLYQRGPAHAGAPDGAAPRDHRAVGPYLSA